MVLIGWWLLLVLSSSSYVLGKSYNTESSDFYLAIPKSVFNYEVFTLYVSNSAGRTVIAQVETLRSFRRFSRWMFIAPRSTYTMRLPDYFEMRGPSDYNKGIHVSTVGSGRTISVSLMRHALASTLSAEYLALPPVTYPGLNEYVYYVASYQWNNRVVTNYTSIILLVGTQTNTSVVITPVQQVEIPAHFRNPNYKWSLVEPGESYSFKLDAMETAQFENYYDLTGSKIMSDKPLTVIGSHECTDIPIGRGFCDAIVEQFPPTVTWGRFFLVAALHSRLTGERYRFISKTSATTIKINCVNSSLPEFGHVILFLNNSGQVREFELGRDSYCSVMADKPILLVQYSQGYSMDNVGDPFMTVIPPMLQYRTGPIMVYSPRAFHNHITITISPEDYGNGRNIYLNNTMVRNWRPIYCGRSSICGYGARRSVPVGTHKIHHALDQAKFFVMSYGFEYHDGYGSTAGVGLQHIADICQHGEVRLTSRNESEVQDGQEGRVEVCLHGVWNRICGSSGWSASDAIVVCRQVLGPDNVMGVSVTPPESTINATWHYAIGDVECVGTESQLVDCKWSTDNIADDTSLCPYATVKCYSSVNVSVELSPSSPLPHFIRNPATFDCMAAISPPLTNDMSLNVSWRKNREYISGYSLNDTYQIHPQVEMKKKDTSKSLFMSTLSMASLKMDDAASYECMAMVMLKGSGRPLAPPTIKSFNLSIYEPPSILFQLKLSGVGQCSQWLLKFESPIEKGKEISDHVTRHLHTNCTNCSIEHHIVADAIFRCFAADSDHVTFRAKLYDTGRNILPSMVNTLRDWVRKGPLVAIKGLLLAVDPNCVVVIESLDDPECVGGRDMPLVTTVTRENATTEDATVEVASTTSTVSSTESSTTPKLKTQTSSDYTSKETSANLHTTEELTSADLYTSEEPTSANLHTTEEPTPADLITSKEPTTADLRTTEEPPSTNFHTSKEPTSAHLYTSEETSSAVTTTTTTTNAVLLDKKVHHCGNQTQKPHLQDTHLTYIIIAASLVVTVLIVALTTIVVVLICVKHSFKKSYNSKELATASVMMSFDEPVEEHSYKSEIPRLDSNTSLNKPQVVLKSRDQQPWQASRKCDRGFREKETLKLETWTMQCSNSYKEKGALELETEGESNTGSKEKFEEMSYTKIDLKDEAALEAACSPQPVKAE